MKHPNHPSLQIGPTSATETITDALEAMELTGRGVENILRGTPIDKLEFAQKAELIENVRAGKHVEAKVTAKTFRQKDGNPNRNHRRFKTSKLEAIAASFTGGVFLLNHNSREQEARKGSILSSVGELDGHGWFNFRQVLHVVKPDAVISFLDGTLDRFSIGWLPTGPIVCTAHGVDVRGPKSCYWREGCYPGKRVELDDGHKIAEYEDQSADGTEVSGVNVPAVLGTRIEDIKQQLSAELSLYVTNPHHEEISPMALPRLAKALGLATLSDGDEDRALAVVAELSAWRDRATTAESELAKSRALAAANEAQALATNIEAAITGAYSEGKLLATRDAKGDRVADVQEASLRTLATTGGLEFLKTFLSTMPQKAPVGTKPALGVDPPRTELAADVTEDAVLAAAAEQLGVSLDDMKANRHDTRGRNMGRFSTAKEG